MSKLISEPRLTPRPYDDDAIAEAEYQIRFRDSLIDELRELRRHVSNLLDRPVLRLDKTSNQSINNTTWTVIDWDSVALDTHGGFNASNDRWTPPVAGYYQINLLVRSNGIDSGFIQAAAIGKNGTRILNTAAYSTATGGTPSAVLSCIVSLNGLDDYVDFQAWQNSGGAANVRGTGDAIDTVVTAMRILDQPSVR